MNFFFMSSIGCSRLSLHGHLYKTDTSVKRTPRVGPCLSLLPSFDSLLGYLFKNLKLVFTQPPPRGFSLKSLRTSVGLHIN